MSISLNSRTLYQQSREKLSEIYDSRETTQLVYWLMEDCLGLSRTDIAVGENFMTSDEAVANYWKCVHRLQSGEPIQHIVGYAYFLGEKYQVNKSVLIPRPETEQLVQLILQDLSGEQKQILDIGTGSGCIPISLKNRLRHCGLVAWDISPEALAVAEANAREQNAEVRFEHRDIFEDWPSLKWDVIVSNPPYIKPSEKQLMHQNVLDYEPAEALFVPENDPVVFYRRILQKAIPHLLPQGRIYFEINEHHGEDILELASQLNYEKAELLKDFSQKDRMVRISV